jgi:hypothetical protein
MFESLPTGREEEAATGPRKRILVGVIVASAALLVIATQAFSPKTVPWKIEDGKLQIHARSQWNDDYPVCDLDPAHAEIIDLTRNPGWRPAKKVFGFDGSWTAGDFYMQNGKEAELYLVHETKAVLLPRRGAIPVLIGATDPPALIEALRRACPRAEKH